MTGAGEMSMNTPLTESEQAQVEMVFLRYIDEDDAMSIIQDLMGEGYVIAPNWRVVR